MPSGIFGSYGPPKTDRFALRERKYAYARFSLLRALVSALQSHHFADVRIRDLCKAAEVSEPAFYNYFPEKDDLLGYFVAFWGIELDLASRAARPGIAALRCGLQRTGTTAEAHPRLMKELLAFQARADVPAHLLRLPPVTAAERVLAFGDAPGLENLSGAGIRQWLSRNVTAAIAGGELPRTTEAADAAIAFGAVFFGVAGLLAAAEFRGLSEQYLRNLEIVVQGIKNKRRKR